MKKYQYCAVTVGKKNNVIATTNGNDVIEHTTTFLEMFNKLGKRGFKFVIQLHEEYYLFEYEEIE